MISSALPTKKHKPLDKGSKLGFICLALAIVLSISGSRWSKTHNSVSNSSAITVQEYHTIEDGMTYEQIKAIVGSAGKEISRTKIDEIEIVTVEWQGNTTGNSASVKFQNGISIAKVQLGLE